MKKLYLTLALMLGFTGFGLAADDATERVGEAKTVFDEIMAAPDK